MGFGQAQVLEKAVGHVEIIMLPRMDDEGVGPDRLAKGVVKRRDLHEVGPGRSDEVDLAFHMLSLKRVRSVKMVKIVWSVRSVPRTQHPEPGFCFVASQLPSLPAKRV
jgi:hypothetical protein